MKVRYSEKGNVDFDEPIISDDKQSEELIKWFKNNFRENCVEIVEKDKIRTVRLGESDKVRWAKKWSRHERAALCDIYKSTDQIAEELGRTWMSVNPKRGKYIGDFLMYTSRKNIELTKENILEYIQEYLDYKENIKREQREQKKALDLKRRRIEKKIESAKGKKKSQELLLRIQPNRQDIALAIKETDKEIEDLNKKLIEMDEL
jgi:hypothetical protein